MSLSKCPPELVLNIANHIPSKQDLSSLSRTCQDLRFLLNNCLYRRDVESDNPQALFWAACTGRISIARKALSHGANIHARDTSTSPPRNLVQALPRRWESCPTTFDFTPLHIATRFRHESMVRFLVHQGADIHEPFPDHLDGYPLHFVSANGPMGILRLFLERGDEVDVRNALGWTPLYCAVRSFSTCTPDKKKAARIRLLLDYNADPDVESRDGKSPRDLTSNSYDSYIRMMFQDDKQWRIRLHEANWEVWRFREDFLLEEQEAEGDADRTGMLNGSNFASATQDAVKGSKSKRSRKWPNKKRTQAEEAVGIEERKREEKGKQLSNKEAVDLVKLDKKTVDTIAGRQHAWSTIRAECDQRVTKLVKVRGLPARCSHLSITIFKRKGKVECLYCNVIVKQSFQCPDCSAVVYFKCVS
ncbi:uncharacterized protein PADG_03365 [Paracoccidioides brasiliensis Pb18]|uniref:Uncharacterized protein n=1 Tax=Paracoccidioides brasiliensis (strain Pb18) TaxID=502780 RepID=C1G860_PARBD|nr:uncharacterized protein PADG_03365 [Paracoccidioides brasiliensis Pb18]EEH47267.2 hypothetical protein PADG_03365 [Paracoccidioides brasiliensis Pb18]